jgi:hypothetical protein
MSERKQCECGLSIKDRIKFGLYTKIDKHRETDKHKYMLELKSTDPTMWKRVLNEGFDIAKVKCKCGCKVYGWNLLKHENSTIHLKSIAPKSMETDM